MKQYVFWISSTELLAFVISTSLLFSLREYAVFCFYLPHFIRCVAGFFIYNTMPKPDEMMKEIKRAVDAENKFSKNVASSAMAI